MWWDKLDRGRDPERQGQNVLSLSWEFLESPEERSRCEPSWVITESLLLSWGGGRRTGYYRHLFLLQPHETYLLNSPLEGRLGGSVMHLTLDFAQVIISGS